MYYNSKTGQLISTPPWGTSYVSDEIKAQHYADWQVVADDFIPPTAAETKKEQCLKIAAEYQPQFDKLASAFVATLISDNTAAQDSNKIQYANLKKELAGKIGGVING